VIDIAKGDRSGVAFFRESRDDGCSPPSCPDAAEIKALAGRTLGIVLRTGAREVGRDEGEAEGGSGGAGEEFAAVLGRREFHNSPDLEEDGGVRE